MTDKIAQFIQKFPNAEQNKPLAPFTTLQVGGPADLYYALTDINETEDLLNTAKELKIPYFILGGGSNTVFHENGFRGLIIHVKAKTITVEEDRIIADAGALLSLVLQTARKNGLIGMEKFMGLPGTVGGAVRGNAGAFGIETKDVFEKALIYNEEKGIHEETAEYFNFKYRSSTVKARKGQDIVLQVTYKLQKGDPAAVMKENATVIASRLKKQPAGKNTGSFFKNPRPFDSAEGPAIHAGKLLDEAGCKGLSVGEIQVSDQHANWIMNQGNATQTQVIELMKAMQSRVKEKFGIDLEPEVQFVGETGPLTFN
ncbi:MAG: UDP-N-acetylmuramate dehydrogenase [Candidatus Gracilibacteria bacterium]